MIGQNLGAKKTDRAKKTVWVTLVYTLGLAALMVVLVWLMPRQLFGMFTSDKEVIEFGITFLRIEISQTVV